MPQLLLELFSEEIPARMQADAVRALERAMLDRLGGEGLLPEASRGFATPRRLVFVADGLAAAQPDRKEERKGPRVGAPEKAMEGFLKSVGLTTDQLQTREDKKGAFYVALIEREGRPTADVVADIVGDIINQFHWPKSMRWGAGELRWVRPLHSILCTFDGEIVPFEIGGIKSGNRTFGHRFLAPDAIEVKRFDDYEAGLQAAKVVLDPAHRSRVIAEEAKNLVFAEGFELVDDVALLSENVGLVEWPVVIMGAIDETFVRPVAEGGLPPEVLSSAMKKHQKYFSVTDPRSDGLAPRFVTVSNLEAKDGGAAIRAGNERVLRARLSDAKFFWDQDRKKVLGDRVRDLRNIIFHAKIGDLESKVLAVRSLAGQIADQLGTDRILAERAALLAKADLTTEMVGEFPDLQGVMGRYYALEAGEPDEVADAVRDHYRPAGHNDSIPTASVSVSVALADKLDTLAVFWAIDEKPTGSKDPFALRRAALGIIRIILESRLRLPLRPLLQAAHAHHGHGDIDPDVIDDLLGFFADRLKVYLKDKGVRHDLIDAVFALPAQDDLVLLVERVNALSAFLLAQEGADLLTAYKRASNILKDEEKKDKTAYDAPPDPALFAQDEERVLHKAISEAVAEVETSVAKEDFAGAMSVVAELRVPVDNFFNNVTVNTDHTVNAPGDVRRNRLLILSQIRSALDTVADFTKIEG